MRVPVLRQVLLEELEEVSHLVVLGAEPPVVPVCEDRVQEHEPLHKSTERGGLPVPVVRFANCLV